MVSLVPPKIYFSLPLPCSPSRHFNVCVVLPCSCACACAWVFGNRCIYTRNGFSFTFLRFFFSIYFTSFVVVAFYYLFLLFDMESKEIFLDQLAKGPLCWEQGVVSCVSILVHEIEDKNTKNPSCWFRLKSWKPRNGWKSNKNYKHKQLEVFLQIFFLFEIGEQKVLLFQVYK